MFAGTLQLNDSNGDSVLTATGNVEVACVTWRGYHSLPLLKEAGLQAVSWAQAVGLMSGHQLLHGLQYHTKLYGREGSAVSRLMRIYLLYM